MDCISPIKIINPTKYISLDHCDRYVNYVRCGKCFACQQSLQKEWYFRTYYEFRHCLETGGYVYIDTLTYKDSHLPRVSRFVDVPGDLDFVCFDYKDIADFLKRLRITLERKGFDVKNKFKYFVSTEYGIDPKRTHRPHAHILFFVYGDLDNFVLSRAVAKCWKHGRTDGLPFKPYSYVQYNTIRKGLYSAIRVCKYVSKYVNKSFEFKKVVDSRINKIMFHLFEKNNDNPDRSFNDWSRTEVGKKYKRDLIRHLNQFHRQSLGFGAGMLSEIDLDSVMNDNILIVPDSNKVVARLALPLYYKRKLFYHQVEVDGVKVWQPTELGLLYLDHRKDDLRNRLYLGYKTAKDLYKIDIPDIDALVDYVLNKRGRIKGKIPGDSLIEVRLGAVPLLYNYVTTSDALQFNTRFVSDKWLGNKTGYKSLVLAETITPNEFIKDFVYFNPDLETILAKIDMISAELDSSMQRLSENKDRLSSIYKSLGAF